MPRKIPDTTRELLSTEKWLVDKHVHQLVSIVELAAELSVTPNVVRKALRRFGIKSPSQQALRAASNMRKYGVTNPGAVPEFRQKALTTMEKKYGGHNWSTHNRTARDATCLALYGSANVGTTEYARNKAIVTNQFLYGRDHINQIHIADDVINNLHDKQWMYDQHITQQKSLSQLASELGFGKDMTTVMRHLHNHGIETKHHTSSFGEKQVVSFIESLGISVVCNTRTVIPPKELDIYIPSHNIAIEYCGLYWHGEQRGKSRTYHKNKQTACKEHNIQLITLYDSEWESRRYCVEQKLRTLLGQNKDSVYARQCTIVELTSHQKAEFLAQYHIQGAGPGSISYGLMHKQQLVAVMTFINTKAEYILNRYASSLRVVGGFSKLLEHFKRQNQWKTIASFADLRWSDGGLYTRTGFTLEKEIPVDYMYIIGQQPMHKFAFRHSAIQNKLINYDKNLSEWENMKKHNYDRIWDCGKLKFIMQNN